MLLCDVFVCVVYFVCSLWMDSERLVVGFVICVWFCRGLIVCLGELGWFWVRLLGLACLALCLMVLVILVLFAGCLC